MNSIRQLWVRVVDIERQPLENARVRLAGEGGQTVELKPDRASGLYVTSVDQAGSFTLAVAAPQLESQERSVKLPHPPTPEEFVLGREGLPYYFRGKVKTPFEPKLDMLGVTVQAADASLAAEVDALARELGLQEQETSEQVRLNNVRLFRYPSDSAVERQRILEILLASSAVLAAGPLVELFEERLVFLTSQFVVKFAAAVTAERAQRTAEEYGFRIVREIRTAGNAFLLQGEPTHDYRLLDAANRLAVRSEVIYAEPNAVTTSIVFAVTPGDFLVPQQWHIPLIGLPDAWQTLRDANAAGVTIGGPGDRTYGDAGLQIAVFDTGVLSDAAGTVALHPDLQGAVTSGAAKVSAFYDAVAVQPNNAVLTSSHGISCAGVATAMNDNAFSTTVMEGVAGAAGNCRVVAINAPFGAPNLRWADAFAWMAGFDPGWLADGVTYPVGATFPALLAQGADIHTNSVRIPDVGLMDDALDFLATYGRGGRGMVSFLAAGNTAAPISHTSNNTIADHEKVITVAASINTDVRSSYSCIDPSLDICAPSSGGFGQGAPGKVTTQGLGVGNLAGHPGGAMNYMNNFGGTSSATPLAAGVGALMLSINPNLNWLQVRDILRNTAVKIDTGNTSAMCQWHPVGLSPEFSECYGYGRVDAHAAVVIAARDPMATDVVIRDNFGDTGAVPSAGAHWDSPDIWVSKTDDPIPSLTYNQTPPHQNPTRGQDNWVYLRVKNIGTAPTNEVYLRALITHFPGFEFRYPNEWQPSRPPTSMMPSPLVPGSYLIGEELINNLPPNTDVIVKLKWDVSLVPPATVAVANMTVQWHPCLLAEVSPHDGPGPSPAVSSPDVSRYNDLAQKNLTIDDFPQRPGSRIFGVVAGTMALGGLKSLVLDRRHMSPRAQVFVRIDDPRVMQRWLRLARAGTVTAAADLPWRSNGDEPRPARLMGRRTRIVRPRVAPAIVEGQEVVLLDSGGADSLELPLPLRGGQYVALAIGVINSGREPYGSLSASQRLADGEVSAGYEIRA